MNLISRKGTEKHIKAICSLDNSHMSNHHLVVLPGPFIGSGWSNAPSTTKDGRTVNLTVGGPIGSNGITVSAGGGSIFHQTLGRSEYMFFGTDNNLLILETTTSNTFVTLVDFTASQPREVGLGGFGALEGPSTDAPHVQFSQGTGSAFLIYNTDTLGEVVQLGIYRSDDGALLCAGPPPFRPTGQILGESTGTKLIIHYSIESGNQQVVCNLPPS
jgi:hypothetical protein